MTKAAINNKSAGGGLRQPETKPSDLAGISSLATLTSSFGIIPIPRTTRTKLILRKNIFLGEAVIGNGSLTDCRDWTNHKTYTYSALDSGANNCASGLRARGLEPGDAVAILSANRAEFMIAFMGILRAGLIAVPINHKFSHEVIRFIFNDADVKLTICDAERPETLGSNSPVVNFDSSGEDSFNNLLQPGIL